MSNIFDFSDEQLLPYEKCIAKGAFALKDSELLAAIIRTGVKGKSSVKLAEEILANFGSKGLNSLIGCSIEELCSIKGVGKAKAVQISCICELSRRIAKSSATEKLDFSSPYNIASYYMEDLRHLKQEQVILIMLNSKCCLIRDTVVTVGTVNSSVVSAREIFIEAIKNRAVSIILIHNHPSGNPKPSQADNEVTNKVMEAGQIIGIPLLDHIIIGDRCFYSFKKKCIDNID